MKPSSLSAEAVKNFTRPVASIDPAAGEIWATYESTPPERVAAAVEVARRGQPQWHNLGIDRRLRVLASFRRLLYQARFDIIEIIRRESGKPRIEALLADVLPALDQVKFYLKIGKRTLKPVTWRHMNPALKHKKAMLIRKPYGVVAVITPWNYPLQLITGVVVPALLAGNSVVLKPAEYTTSVAMKLAGLLYAAGVPQEVFHLLPGDARTGEALVKSHIDKVVLIGSERAGRSVAQAAAPRFLPFTLELGGSDAMLVLADAPLREAVAAAIWGRFTNAGQTCVAVKRLFVEAPVYEAFTARLVATVEKLRVGPGDAATTDIGPLIRASQIEMLETQLADAVQKGARVLCGGRRRRDLGELFYEPTVLVDVTPDMAVMQEETFGPLLPVVRVRDPEEAIDWANRSRFGLSASIWTKDLRRGREMAERIQAGSVTINDVTFYPGAADVPYGGIKASGFGRSHGVEGLLSMVQEQYIDIDPLPGMYKPWWYRYSADTYARIDRFVTFLHGQSLWQKIASIPGVVSLLFHRDRL